MSDIFLDAVCSNCQTRLEVNVPKNAIYPEFRHVINDCDNSNRVYKLRSRGLLKNFRPEDLYANITFEEVNV